MDQIVVHQIARYNQKLIRRFRDFRLAKAPFSQKVRFEMSLGALAQDEFGVPTLIQLPQLIIGIFLIKNAENIVVIESSHS